MQKGKSIKMKKRDCTARQLATALRVKRQLVLLQAEHIQLQEHHKLLLAFGQVLQHHKCCLQQDGPEFHSSDTLEYLLQQLETLQLPVSSSCCSCGRAAGDVSWRQPCASTTESTADSSSGASERKAGVLAAAWRHLHPSMPQDQQFNGDVFSLGGGSVSHRKSRAIKGVQLLQQDQPAAPVDDPFVLVRLLIEQPLDPRAAHITLQELQQDTAADVQQLASLVHLLEALQAGSNGSSGTGGSSFAAVAAAGGSSAAAAVAEQQSEALATIRDMQLRMSACAYSLALHGREHLWFELMLSNWQTGERLTAPCRQRHLAALQQLQLTPEQHRRLLLGGRMFRGLVAPLVAQRRQLHAQGLKVLPSVGGSSSSGSRELFTATTAAAAARTGPCTRQGSDSSSSGCAHTVSVAYSNQGAQLQAQKEQCDRMRVLERKDSWLRGCSALYLLGCLTWVQQAKLRIAMMPYHVNVGTLYTVLAESSGELPPPQQQQQQQVLPQGMQQVPPLMASQAQPLHATSQG